MKINDILNEGDVIKTKFTQKQQSKNKTPYHYKNFIAKQIPMWDPINKRNIPGDVDYPSDYVDYETLVPYDHFEVKVNSRHSAHIMGITNDGYQVQVSTTSIEIAEALADAYNRGGFSDKDIQQLPLSEEYNHMDSDLKDVASWMDTTVDNLHIEVDMVPIEHFKKQIEEMHSTYEEYPNDASRTEKIIDQIKSGATPLPVYIDISDPTGFVMEGRHRMVAFWLLGMKEIPVAYVYNKTKHSKYITDDIDHLPTGGDCFKVAYRLITSGELPNHDLRLVHAITDRIKDHAWVELGDVVIDKSNGNNFVGRKEQYYEHFGVYPNDPTKFRTYNAQEVNEMAITHMTYGPWEL